LIYLSELENFWPIKEGQTKALKKFADILNVEIVNLKACFSAFQCRF